MPRCFLALGGNVGPVARTFQQALAELGNRPDVRVIRASSVYRTPAVGDSAGGEFQNAAAEIETSRPPLDVLDLLHDVENRFGRVRLEHWGPRTLDLDLLFYGSEILDEPRLRVPHPALWYRRFVLEPLAEIAADFVHPEKGITVGALRDRLRARPLAIELAGGHEGEIDALLARLPSEFPDIRLEPWDPRRSQPEPAIVAWLGANGRAPAFERLPLVARLDASGVAANDRPGFLRDVIASAVGGPEERAAHFTDDTDVSS
jgi:2-amino-4-hydroxy-6-hydroxymethyldihydropteridine diphosphokinase